MAERTQKYPENAPGAYYVDEQCICCHRCSETAPQLFRESEEGDYHIVFRQPENESDRQLAEEALDGCPVQAIGDDGI